MRLKDFSTVLQWSVVCGFALTLCAYFIWKEGYKAAPSGFWLSIAGIALAISPLWYFHVRQQTRCPQCSTPFAISETHQASVESVVRYKSETVIEQGQAQKRDVPYNVRGYFQHTQCDHCGHQSKYQAAEEHKS